MYSDQAHATTYHLLLVGRPPAELKVLLHFAIGDIGQLTDFLSQPQT